MNPLQRCEYLALLTLLVLSNVSAAPRPTPRMSLTTQRPARIKPAPTPLRAPLQRLPMPRRAILQRSFVPCRAPWLRSLTPCRAPLQRSPAPLQGTPTPLQSSPTPLQGSPAPCRTPLGRSRAPCRTPLITPHQSSAPLHQSSAPLQRSPTPRRAPLLRSPAPHPVLLSRLPRVINTSQLYNVTHSSKPSTLIASTTVSPKSTPASVLTNLTSVSSMSPNLTSISVVSHNLTSVPSELVETTPVPIVLTSDLYVPGFEKPHPELCPMLGMNLKLLILVMSAPKHKKAREVIRLTWGHFAMRTDVVIGFMLGEPPSKLRAAIDAEDALYGDIIMGRSVDSYSNLTLKTLSMLEWMDTYCPRAPRMLKTDDDVFINVPRLLEWVAEPERVNATRTIWGHIMGRSYPKRNPDCKYYVSSVQFPPDKFPDYMTGASYLLTGDLVRQMLQAAPFHPYIPIEDVFITGVLGDYIGLTLEYERTFFYHMCEDPCLVQRGIAILEVSYTEQFDLWSKLFEKCRFSS